RRRSLQPSPTASLRGILRESICCSLPDRFSRLQVPILVQALAISSGLMCIGSRERPAIPRRAIIKRKVNWKNKIWICVVLVSSLLASSCGRKAEVPADPHVVRCAVIGGMTMTGLWPEIAKRFEAETGYKVEVIVTGPRPILDEAMRAGKVDLLTMHSGDITTDLVADGYGVNMRPWTRNELCIVGPPDDPAHLRGITNGAEALKKIAATKSHFVDFQGIG